MLLFYIHNLVFLIKYKKIHLKIKCCIKNSLNNNVQAIRSLYFSSYLFNIKPDINYSASK